MRSTPGSNLYKLAINRISLQTLTYFKWISRNENDVGEYDNLYDLPVSIRGSFQPVSRNLYEQYGLALQKNYFFLYTDFDDLRDLSRNASIDLISFQGVVYQIESATKWFSLDGWVQVLCCATNLPEPSVP